MICPKCDSKSKVYNSRAHGETIRRNRECLECTHRYVTVETLERKVNKPVKTVKDPPIKKPKFEDMNFDNMTDEEIEAALFSD